MWAPDVWRDPGSGRFYLYYTVNQTVGVAESLLASVEAQKQAGDASGLDLLRARAELAELRIGGQ